MMHDGADTINADPGICGLAVPKPRTQALDLLDDHRCETIQNRGLGDTSVEEDAPQPGTAVGEGCQHRRVGASDSIEGAADQCGEIRVGLRHRTEHLPASRGRLDIADPDLDVPLAGLATPDEGRSKVTTIASDGVAGSAAAGVDRRSATLKVWRRKVS